MAVFGLLVTSTTLSHITPVNYHNTLFMMRLFYQYLMYFFISNGQPPHLNQQCYITLGASGS